VTPDNDDGSGPQKNRTFTLTDPTCTIGDRVRDLTMHVRVGISHAERDSEVTTAVRDISTIAADVIERVLAQRDVVNGGGRGRVPLPHAPVHPHAHDAKAAGILRLEGLGLHVS
jgi:hypothetical protein